MLQHIENFEDKLVQMVTRDLRLHMQKFQVNIPLMEASLSIIIQSLKVYDRHYLTGEEQISRSEDFSFLLTLVARLGLGSLRLFGTEWYTYLKCADAKRIIEVLSPDISSARTVPKEVVALIMQYFGANQQHGESACDLLKHFKPADANYKAAVNKICENAMYYSANALFEIARYEVKVAPSPPPAKKGRGSGAAAVVSKETMNKDAFAVIEKAIENLTRTSAPNITSVTYAHLDWVCDLCNNTPVSKEVPKGYFFSEFIKLLQKHAKCHPGVLMRILQYVEKMPALLKVANVLGDTLVESYQAHFTQRLRECGHAAYSSVINEMHRARLQCRQYTKNGDSKFDIEVVKHVRSCHNGKKKLLKMLDQEFDATKSSPR